MFEQHVDEEDLKTQLLIYTIWWKLFCKRTVVSECCNVLWSVRKPRYCKRNIIVSFPKIGILKVSGLDLNDSSLSCLSLEARSWLAKTLFRLTTFTTYQWYLGLFCRADGSCKRQLVFCRRFYKSEPVGDHRCF